MKKHRFFQAYKKAGLAFLFLSAGTLSFAQRHEGGGGGGRGSSAPQRSSAPAQHFSSPQRQFSQPSRPSYQSAQRSSVPRQPDYRNPNFNRQPANERSAVRQTQSSTVNNRVIASNRVGIDNRYTTNNYRGGGGRFYGNGGAYYHPHYNRPPIVYGGYGYYAHFNYTYHPYRPYYYGSFFHPIGFFVGALSGAALTFALNDQYYLYDQGVYYQPYNNGYQAVQAPTGAAITYLPKGYSTIDVDGDSYYYYGGTFYTADDNGGYMVVPAPPGAIVYDLPEGATELKLGEITYLQYNGALFQPIVLDGRDGYEVVDKEKLH
jgi:hypothetical protein